MKYKEIILLLGSIFFIVIVWIAFNIYHNSVMSTIPDNLKKETLPIKPSFDNSTINKLSSRAIITPIYNIIPLPSVENAEVIPEINPEINFQQESTTSALTASEGGGLTQ